LQDVRKATGILVNSRSKLEVAFNPEKKVQPQFDKRESLKREKVYKREVFCAFWLVSQTGLAAAFCKRELHAC
jgi:hypothetical protein